MLTSTLSYSVLIHLAHPTTLKIKTVNNIVPDCWIYVQEPQVKMLRLQIFNNWSPYLVKDAENTVWIGLEYTCQEGDKYWNMSDEELDAFLFSLGCYSGEPITVISRKRNNCVVSIKDARYNIDIQLAKAIII